MKQSMRRLCILKIEDEEGIIDQYIFYLLENLRPFIDDFMIFSKVKIRERDLQQLQVEMYGVKVNHCENLTQNYLKQYEQVLWMDDSFFGPIYSLYPMFEKMNCKQLDFWGVTQMPEVIDCEGQSHLSKLQPYFMMLNKPALLEQAVVNLFCEKTKEKYFAQQLLTLLSESELQWESYISTSPYEAEEKEKNVDCSLVLSYELVKKEKCPFITKESLLHRNYAESTGENARNALDFIKEHTNYNCGFIWEHMLRTSNVLDIKEALHLEYVFPWKLRDDNEHRFNKIKAAIIVHLHYADRIEDCFSYLEQIPSEIEIYMTTSSYEIKCQLQYLIQSKKMSRCHVIQKENRGRDVSALLVACKDILLKYDYLCFIHDKKSNSYLKTVTGGKSYMYAAWENTVKSKEYIHQVLQCFIQNPYLGFLTPPDPYQDVLLGNLGKSFAGSFAVTKDLAKELKLNCNLDEKTSPIAVSTTFWCRTKAMYPLFSHSFAYTDFQEEPMDVEGTISHAIERIFPYVAQSEGYYTGIMMNSDYASLRGTALQALLVKTLNVLRKNHVILDVDDIENMEHHTENLLEFVRTFPHIYIYGAGNYGQICANVITRHGEKFEGYLVSKGKKKGQQMREHPIYEITEMTESSELCGIIVAMNVRYQKEVIPELENLGYHHRFCIG